MDVIYRGIVLSTGNIIKLGNRVKIRTTEQPPHRRNVKLHRIKEMSINLFSARVKWTVKPRALQNATYSILKEIVLPAAMKGVERDGQSASTAKSMIEG